MQIGSENQLEVGKDIERQMSSDQAAVVWESAESPNQAYHRLHRQLTVHENSTSRVRDAEKTIQSFSGWLRLIMFDT